MAVARIKFPDRAAAFQASGVIEALHPRGAREVRASVDRPGRQAELTGEEARHLAERAELLWPRTRRVIEEAIVQLDAAEAYDARRPRGPELTRLYVARKRGDH